MLRIKATKIVAISHSYRCKLFLHFKPKTQTNCPEKMLPQLSSFQIFPAATRSETKWCHLSLLGGNSPILILVLHRLCFIVDMYQKVCLFILVNNLN